MQQVEYLTMPGRITDMSVSGDNLFVLCIVERRWWQFWKPRRYKRLVTLTADDISKIKPLPM